ncbi:Phage major capsid protein [Cronobacter universalis NCTC 9529]|uniref:Phage major capsid protein, P2 family n=1 Tax=Cronobacter universalis NCTC 9529 TaxID=1074000 RepID=A0ABY1W6J7_9ENTR|nr:P2 family phage major capsid protein [Cronobacter universalis]CCK15694.1 Phage major capsid protein [Cronobacter universalis NCTC 9529]STD14906.1 phage major capsid protein, P2 family [Cronobacter universalis NCTC 9529]
MQLNQRARDLIGAYSAALCQGYNVQQTDRYFSLTDPKETALRLALLEAVEFLNMITCADVDQLSGQVVSVGSSALHTGRKEGGRFMRSVGVDGNDYKLVETDSCAALKWDLLSVWANAGKEENEFFNLVQTFSNQAFALDMLRIGFNGNRVEKTTDPEQNPNGEDVNIGWHKLMKGFESGKQIITDAVTLDDKGDYRPDAGRFYKASRCADRRFSGACVYAGEPPGAFGGGACHGTDAAAGAQWRRPSRCAAAFCANKPGGNERQSRGQRPGAGECRY